MSMLPSGLIRLKFQCSICLRKYPLHLPSSLLLSAMLFEKKIFKNYTRDAKQGMISYDNSRKICLRVLLRKED